MNIKKITITPLMNGCSEIVSRHPSAKSAGILIKERLASGRSYDDNTARVFRKLPEWMKGFVNPKSIVSKERKFTING